MAHKFPRLGALNTGNDAGATSETTRNLLAKCKVVIMGAQGDSTFPSGAQTRDTVYSDIKTKSANITPTPTDTKILQYVDYNEDPGVIAAITTRNTSSNWYLYEYGTSGTTVKSTKNASWPLINMSRRAPTYNDGTSGALYPYQYYALFSYQRYVQGQTGQTAHATSKIDGFVVDNYFTNIKVNNNQAYDFTRMAVDDFNRADAASSTTNNLGSNWTIKNSFASSYPIISGGKMTSAERTSAQAYYTGISYDSDQFAEVVVNGNDGIVNLEVRTDITTHSCYVAQFGGDSWRILRFDNNVETALTQFNPYPVGHTRTFTNDVLRAEVVGSTIKAILNGYTIGSVTNQTAYTSGVAGLVWYHGGGTTFDNWKSGSLIDNDAAFRQGQADFPVYGRQIASTLKWGANVPVNAFDNSVNSAINLGTMQNTCDVGYWEYALGNQNTSNPEYTSGAVEWLRIAKDTFQYIMTGTDPLLVVNCNLGTSPTQKHVRYCLGLVTLTNGYFHDDNTKHGYSPTDSSGDNQAALRVWDEAKGGSLNDLNWLGDYVDVPQYTPWSGTVYRRRFANGAVFVNDSRGNATSIDLTGYKRISGTLDSTVNDGTTVGGSYNLQPGDAIFVLNDTHTNTEIDIKAIADLYDNLVLYNDTYSEFNQYSTPFASWITDKSRDKSKFSSVIREVPTGSVTSLQNNLMMNNIGYFYLTNQNRSATDPTTHSPDDNAYWSSVLTNIVSTPTNLSVSITNGIAQISCGTSYGQTSYDIYRGSIAIGSTSSTVSYSFLKNVTSFPAQDSVVSGYTYYYKIIARNDSNLPLYPSIFSSYSNPVSVTYSSSAISTTTQPFTNAPFLGGYPIGSIDYNSKNFLDRAKLLDMCIFNAAPAYSFGTVSDAVSGITDLKDVFKTIKDAGNGTLCFIYYDAFFTKPLGGWWFDDQTYNKWLVARNFTTLPTHPSVTTVAQAHTYYSFDSTKGFVGNIIKGGPTDSGGKTYQQWLPYFMKGVFIDGINQLQGGWRTYSKTYQANPYCDGFYHDDAQSTDTVSSLYAAQPSPENSSVGQGFDWTRDNNSSGSPNDLIKDSLLQIRNEFTNIGAGNYWVCNLPQVTSPLSAYYSSYARAFDGGIYDHATGSEGDTYSYEMNDNATWIKRIQGVQAICKAKSFVIWSADSITDDGRDMLTKTGSAGNYNITWTDPYEGVMHSFAACCVLTDWAFSATHTDTAPYATTTTTTTTTTTPESSGNRFVSTHNYPRKGIMYGGTHQVPYTIADRQFAATGNLMLIGGNGYIFYPITNAEGFTGGNATREQLYADIKTRSATLGTDVRIAQYEYYDSIPADPNSIPWSHIGWKTWTEKNSGQWMLRTSATDNSFVPLEASGGGGGTYYAVNMTRYSGLIDNLYCYQAAALVTKQFYIDGNDGSPNAAQNIAPSIDLFYCDNIFSNSGNIHGDWTKGVYVDWDSFRPQFRLGESDFMTYGRTIDPTRGWGGNCAAYQTPEEWTNLTNKSDVSRMEWALGKNLQIDGGITGDEYYLGTIKWLQKYKSHVDNVLVNTDRFLLVDMMGLDANGNINHAVPDYFVNPTPFQAARYFQALVAMGPGYCADIEDSFGFHSRDFDEIIRGVDGVRGWLGKPTEDQQVSPRIGVSVLYRDFQYGRVYVNCRGASAVSIDLTGFKRITSSPTSLGNSTINNGTIGGTYNLPPGDALFVMRV